MAGVAVGSCVAVPVGVAAGSWVGVLVGAGLGARVRVGVGVCVTCMLSAGTMVGLAVAGGGSCGERNDRFRLSAREAWSAFSARAISTACRDAAGRSSINPTNTCC